MVPVTAAVSGQTPKSILSDGSAAADLLVLFVSFFLDERVVGFLNCFVFFCPRLESLAFFLSSISAIFFLLSFSCISLDISLQVSTLDFVVAFLHTFVCISGGVLNTSTSLCEIRAALRRE